MLKNTFKTGWRVLVRQKWYALVNGLGLAIGMTCFILISLYVSDEVNYDRFHRNAGRIYRLLEFIEEEDRGEHSSSNPFPTGPTLAADFPHLIESQVRFFDWQLPSLTLQYEDNKFNESGIYFVDSTVFQVFDYPLLAGDPEKALSKPNAIVVTREFARKYFGSEDPMGKTIKYEGQIPLSVTGVFADLPEQSHIQFDALVSLQTVFGMSGPNFGKSWVWNPCWTYLLFRSEVNPDDLSDQFPGFVQKYYPDFIKHQVTHHLQRLTDIHLKSHLDYEMQSNSDLAAVYVFAIIGMMILGVAYINFMNLSTARSSSRMREIAMRKVMGAERNHLVVQFLGESVLVALISVVFSILFTELLLPVFNALIGRNLVLNWASDPLVMLMLLLLAILSGVLAGIYPALYLSAPAPVQLFRGNLTLDAKKGTFRKSLVVLQFAVSVGLIVSALVVYDQWKFLQDAKLGFNRDATILIPVRPPMIQRIDGLQEQLRSDAAVYNTTIMNEVIGRHHNTHEFNFEGMEAGKWAYFPGLVVSETFTQTFDIPMVAGRGFSKEFPRDDSLSILINESMVKYLGWGSPDQALGKSFFTPTGKERVAGVFMDFHFESLANPTGPFVLDIPHKNLRPFFNKFLAVRLRGDIHESIGAVEGYWNRIYPEFPFEYTFLDESLRQQYDSQSRLGRLIGYFSVVAVLIACLGLFALASYSVEQRTKEIGIRKVMGASVMQIVLMFSKDFMLLIVLATGVGFVASYLAMNLWLSNFAFKTSLQVSSFILSGTLALGVAWLTIGYQSWKAAKLNPAQALKYE